MPDKELAREIVIREIASSTGPTGGWLDSPKAICASIVSALDAAASGEALRWIPVEEKLPENDGRVLVLRSTQHWVDIKCYYKQDRWTSGFYADGEMDTNVTHWQPLPASPERYIDKIGYPNGRLVEDLKPLERAAPDPRPSTEEK